MKTKSFLAILITVAFLSCHNKPKVIPVTSDNINPNAPSIFSESGSSSQGNVDYNSPTANEFHSVVVNEVLPTSKYVYLNVTEGDEKYWIATRSMEVNVGGTYYYKEGLLKTNFESKEYNRVFDKMYLIGSLVSADHGNTAKSETIGDYPSSNQGYQKKEDIPMHTEKIVQHQGSMKIAELVKDPKKYEGRTVQLDGVCTKDGSQDDYDLVVTSDAYVRLGEAFTIKAVVALNKDFGAGYKYDLILENGMVIK